jgi:hypothetical protein
MRRLLHRLWGLHFDQDELVLHEVDGTRRMRLHNCLVAYTQQAGRHECAGYLSG